MANTDNYNFNDEKPPNPRDPIHIVPPENAPNFGRGTRDSAWYLINPDTDFARPYLAIPGTSRAFIWPLGTEGFELQDQAQLGRHKYLGDIELDVDVVHKAETTIVLSGVFPGWTSVENMNALRAIFYMDTPERGKILHLPGILPHLQYVVCDNESFRHTEDERTMDMAYTITLVKVGTGKRAPYVGPTQPNQGRGKKGRTAKRYRTTATINTLRKVSKAVYKTEKRWTDLYAIKKNADWYNKRHIATHLVPDYRLPKGHVVWY